jgi:HAE1 family hydrophobic/amphiphilic exporter-1
MVPYSDLVTLRESEGPNERTRYDLFDASAIRGRPAEGYTSADAIAAIREVARATLPRSYDIAWEGLSYDEARRGHEAIAIFLVVLAFVYRVLAAQCESFVLPFAVLLSLPTGVLGAFLALRALGLANDVYAQVGIVTLVGLLGKNGVLIVEFAVQAAASGTSIAEAAAEGAKARFRPILMTSFAFVAGLLPLVRAAERAALLVGAAIGIAGAVTGCVPAMPVALRDARSATPSRFDDAGEAPAAAALDDERAAEADLAELFADPSLDELIEEALAHNQELGLATLEMLAANAEVMGRRGEVLPSLGLDVADGIDRPIQTTPQGRVEDASGLPGVCGAFGVGLRASRELDVWRRLRDSADRAAPRYLASAEGCDFVAAQPVAEVAPRYDELLALDRERAVLDAALRVRREMIDVMRAELQAVRVTAVAVSRFEAQRHAFEARRYEVLQDIAATDNALALLLGRFPPRIPRRDDDFLALVPPVVRTGVPARLLRNRPDVRRAERLLAAAKLDVSAARARFFPALRIEAGAGYRSYDPAQLFLTPTSIAVGLLGGITAPLLNRSGITAEYCAAGARQMQAVRIYERAILAAFLEVRTDLRLVANMGGAVEARSAQVDRLRDALEGSRLLFQAARADYLELPTARQELLDAQLELVDAKLRQLTGTVALYCAAGGGCRRRGGAEVPPPMGARPRPDPDRASPRRSRASRAAARGARRAPAARTKSPSRAPRLST